MLARTGLLPSLAAAIVLLAGCGTSNDSTPSISAAPGNVQVRFIQGSPSLEAIIGGQPTDLGPSTYLSVDGTTVASSFLYAYLTPFANYHSGSLSLEALDSSGYKVGPVKTTALAAGKSYTVALVGTYPNYKALAFEEPAPQSRVTVSAYGASPSVPNADFGSFVTSGQRQYKKLGSVTLGEIATTNVGTHVTNFGAYIGHGTMPVEGGAIAVESVDSFDTRGVLPFHSATRLSLFFLDPKGGQSLGPVLGSLDQ
jgi:hypothetical protein